MSAEAITVGAVPILHRRFSDWTYPQFGSIIKVLSDGSSIDNETLQTSALPRLRATLSGWIQESADMELLKGYVATKEIVAVVDDAVSRDAVILDLVIDRILPSLWSCDLTLIDFTADGS